MGIYIKGMEMPADDMKNIMILADGRVFQFSGYGNPKPLGTAIPVPPHGDLIDRDKTVKTLAHDYAYAAADIVRNEIPPVIPAEESEG